MSSGVIFGDPKLFARAGAGHGGLGNFLKGCAWAPGGGALLTASDDGRLRVFPVAEGGEGEGFADPRAHGGEVWDGAPPALEVAPGGAVNDYAWFPGASFLPPRDGSPIRPCFFSTARGGPAQLWDAWSGDLRAAYRADCADLDELLPALSLAVSPDGAALALGFRRGELRLFDVGRPGRHATFRVPRVRRGGGGTGTPALWGIMSSLCFCPTTPRLLAAGSYDGQAALYDPAAGDHAVVLLYGGHGGAGVSQVLFSRDGNYLYTGARRERSIVCWDARQTARAVYALERPAEGTNQRITFDIEPCGRRLATGGEDGRVRVFDLTDGRPVAEWAAAADPVNGCSFHPTLPALASSSGARVFPDVVGTDSEGDGEGRRGGDGGGPRNCLRVWSLPVELSGLEEPSNRTRSAAATPTAEAERPAPRPTHIPGAMWGLNPAAAVGTA